MCPSLNDALHLVRLHLCVKWYSEPADHKADGFYRAKDYLRGILGGLVFIHPQDNELLAFVSGKMHRAAIV